MERSGIPGPSILVGFTEENAKCLYTKNTALFLRSDMNLGYESNAPLFDPNKKAIFHIFLICIIALCGTEYFNQEKNN